MRETGRMSAFFMFLFIEKEKGLVKVSTVYSECCVTSGHKDGRDNKFSYVHEDIRWKLLLHSSIS